MFSARLNSEPVGQIKRQYGRDTTIESAKNNTAATSIPTGAD